MTTFFWTIFAGEMSRGSSSTIFVPSALRLRQASRALHARTHEVWLHADTRRLRWLPERSLHCEISANGFTVRCSAPRTALACGAPLLTAGVSRWRVHIAHIRADSASLPPYPHAYVVELDDDCTVRRDVDAKGGCMLVRLELVQVTVVVSRMALDGKRHVVVYA